MINNNEFHIIILPYCVSSKYYHECSKLSREKRFISLHKITRIPKLLIIDHVCMQALRTHNAWTIKCATYLCRQV